MLKIIVHGDCHVFYMVTLHRDVCSVSLSFSTADPLVVPAAFNFTVACPDSGTVIDLYTEKGPAYVSVNAWLIFEGCDVHTIKDLADGTATFAPPALGTGYLGTSEGNVLFKDSRFLFPQQVSLSSHSPQFQASKTKIHTLLPHHRHSLTSSQPCHLPCGRPSKSTSGPRRRDCASARRPPVP